MLPTVEEVKESLRIDHNEDDDMIQEIILSADDYIFSAISASKDDYITISEYPQYKWAVSLLAQHRYTHRQERDMTQHIPMVVTSIIQQMRGRYYADN